MKKILLLNGPNLNRLGVREPTIYGSMTLESLESSLKQEASSAGFALSCFQSNSESDLINAIHEASDHHTNFIIFNPAAFTHTSIALRDALTATKIPFFEVHISNIHRRESFRHHSWFSDIAEGVISGFGIKGYSLALQAVIDKLTTNP